MTTMPQPWHMVDPQSWNHADALYNVFKFMQASESSWNAGVKKHYESAERDVLRFIARGIPCGNNYRVAGLFLNGPRWRGRVDLGVLWRAYAAGGYINPDESAEIEWKTEHLLIHPLEVAILRGHLECLAELIEMGANLSAVPSRPWFARPGSKRPVKDILGFVTFAVPEIYHRTRQETALLISKALMLQAINRGPVPPPTTATALPATESTETSLPIERRRRRAV